MAPPWLRDRSPTLVSAFGAGLFVVALVHHGTEVKSVGSLSGPTLALALDGISALGLVYVGYWLSNADVESDHLWTAASWTFVGAGVFAAVMVTTQLVRLFEGRPVTEPLFPILVAAEVGGLAGALAGFSTARARSSERTAHEVTGAFVFVNDVIRHDLRNDLNVVAGYAGQVDGEAGTVIADKTEEALARIETTSELAATMLGDPDLEVVDLAAVTERMADQVDEAFPVTVRTDLPPSAPVRANRGLRSVVDNLLENAAEHNDASDPVVEAAVENDGDVVRLTVSDNGSGVPDHEKHSVFEPVADGGGASGLALVRRLVDAYDGAVWVADDTRGGAEFVVELPRAEED